MLRQTSLVNEVSLSFIAMTVLARTAGYWLHNNVQLQFVSELSNIQIKNRLYQYYIYITSNNLR